MEPGVELEAWVREHAGRGRDNFTPLSPVERARGAALASSLLNDEPPPLDFALTPHGPFRVYAAPPGHGWLVFLPAGDRSRIVEAPHPVSDAGTFALALAVAARCSAGFVLLAGAHRYNARALSAEDPRYRQSDAAHSAAPLFSAWHEMLAGPGCRVLQLHGFSALEAARRCPGFPSELELVFAATPKVGAPLLSAFAAAGFAAWQASDESPARRRYLAQHNLQRRSMAARGLFETGARFLHVELDAALRGSGVEPELIERLARALECLWID